MGKHAGRKALLPLIGAVLVYALAACAEAPPGEQPALLRVELSAASPAVRFGDELAVEATLLNEGTGAITLAPKTLRFEPHGWTSTGTGGTGHGPDVLVPADDAGLVVPPGGKATVVFPERERTARVLGPVSCDWRVWSEDADLQRLLGKPATLRVRFEVRPSQLMESAWAARTDEDRAMLLPAVRDLLRRRSKAILWPERFFLEGTFEYLAASALPLLDALADDPDPVVRAQVIQQYRYSAWAVGNMAGKIQAAQRGDAAYAWAKPVPPGDRRAAEEACVRRAMAGLKDPAALVRLSAVKVLTWEKHGPAEEVKRLVGDPDASVRAAVQDYLALFGGRDWAAEAIVAALGDADEKVRAQALEALETSPEPPPLAALKRAFAAAKGLAAERLVALLFEQENADLPETLLAGFAARSEREKLAILAAVAGQADEATFEIARLGLADESAAVQRQAVMRLLPFAPEKAGPLLDAYRERSPAELRTLADAARKEIRERTLFPFLGRVADETAAGTERPFPSKNGTVPMVSPDGKWVAYVETGWGRPGGSGGTGRTNLLTLVHVIGSDGRDDRILSDMFLVGWMADSRRVGSARDGFAAITDLEGTVVAEFGEVLNAPGLVSHPSGDWRNEELRTQFGGSMPHRKRLDVDSEDHYGERAAFSPDGKWFGPGWSHKGATFIGADGQPRTIPGVGKRGGQAAWSPDGRYIWLSGVVLDFHAGYVTEVPDVQPADQIESWEYRECRWNPWARDGSRLALLRGGEVWTFRPDGAEGTQLTFSMPPGWRPDRAVPIDPHGSPWRKAFPTFGPHGRSVAYLRYQVDRRLHYARFGPTDLWVIDRATTLEARMTRPAPGRIHCLDWLNDRDLIFDRVSVQPTSYQAELRTVSLAKE